jgi:hypothetical protein
VTRLSIIGWLCALLTGLTPLHAQDLFDRDTPLDIVLTGPIGSLVEHRQDRSAWPFRLEVNGRSLEVRIRARGNSRMRLCDFPPLRFDLNDAATGQTEFEGLASLKAVMPCKRGEHSAANVLEEYAVYRIFNLISEASLRVRLIRFTFSDTDDRLNGDFLRGFGFFIEPADRLATRMGGERADVSAVSLASLDPQQAARVFVFQYLVANTDWSLVAPEGSTRCCHNIELVDIGSKRYPVPYDFDLTGLVNARYARPDPSLRIRRVRQRLYRGFCMDPDVVNAAIRDVASKEDEVFAIIDGLPLLSAKEKTRQRDYLGKFFESAGDGDKLLESFGKKCLS